MAKFNNPLNVTEPDFLSHLLEGCLDDLNDPTRTEDEWKGTVCEIRAFSYFAAMFHQNPSGLTCGQAIRYGLDKLEVYVRDQVRRATFGEARKAIEAWADKRGW